MRRALPRFLDDIPFGGSLTRCELVLADVMLAG
ncbi:MAG: hypothetical protein AVDCRST_MAG22-3022 [uncultured Rubrobacteraceae bacterium]|uniref:Uncharacterized protein n=1 Tax=uncultured Rubrobacteraceae bacterium TaxID=349277 RepID=A0A6J4PWF5_9ACTN|nr:MAG: hypothetical protein AVDCRST_MAG22-3022 [uncultured Rubrobacteraceae bacterium]